MIRKIPQVICRYCDKIVYVDLQKDGRYAARKHKRNKSQIMYCLGAGYLYTAVDILAVPA